MLLLVELRFKKTSHTVHVDIQAHSHYLKFKVLHRHNLPQEGDDLNESKKRNK